MSVLLTLSLQLACELLDPTPRNVTVDLPSGYTVFPEVGLAYKHYPNLVTWNEARKQCITDGGSLFVADSRQKINLIMGWDTVRDKGLHNGIHRCFDTTEWTSVKDGQPVKFVPWKPEPFLDDQDKCCSAHFNDGSGVGAWKCDINLNFVCEIPLVSKSRADEIATKILPLNCKVTSNSTNPFVLCNIPPTN